jgi:hypothetical protein
MLREMKSFIYLLLIAILGLSSFFAYAQNGIIEDKIWSRRQIDSNVVTETSLSNYIWVPCAPGYQNFLFGNNEFSVGPNQRIYPTTNTTQSEISIDIHPTNPNILFGSANTTSWPVTTFYGTGLYWSMNGGVNWSGSDIPPFGTTSGDPAAVIGTNGNFYLGYINISYGQGVSVSTNNGSSWLSYTVAPNPGTIADKNHLMIDKKVGSPYENRVYDSWTDFGGTNNNQVVIKYSTNFGAAWSSAINLSSSLNPASFAQGCNIQTGPNGEVYTAFAIYDTWGSGAYGEDAIGFAKSTNGGTSFTKSRIYSAPNFGIRGNLKPTNIRVSSFPSMTVDRSGGSSNGYIYIVWAQRGVSPAGSDPDIVLIKSTNNGSTWSSPVRVNDDPLNNGKDQYYPWCTVDQTNGALHIVFYDNRNTTNDSSGVYMATSFDGGLTFDNYQVSDANFKPKPISGLAEGYQGDYIGIVASNGKAYPVWAEDRSGNYQAWFTEVSFIPVILTKDVLVEQKLSTNSSVDSIGLWNSTQNKFNKYSAPQTFTWNVNDTKTLQGSQKVLSNQKYNYWSINDINISDAINHKSFIVIPTTDRLKSQFNPTNSGITIKNSLEGTGIDGGSVQFKDPWLIDYADPDYANTLRNRGMDNEGLDKLEFKNQTSPFIPDYTSSFNGDVYKGIFLNQTIDPTNPQKAYYSVGSLSEQTISVNSQNRKFYPFKWGGTGVTLQGEYWSETGIVFTSTNAVATATLKGQLMSNSTTGISSNSQRKMVRTDNGIYHVVYESMGNVFYTHSLTSNFDGEWAADMWFYDHAKNPAIEYDGNIVKAVCEYYDPAFLTTVELRLITFTQQPDGRYGFTDDEPFATCPSSYFGSAKPVISYNAAGVALIYRNNSTEGLKLKTKWYDGTTWSWQAESTIPQTDANSINPSIIGEIGIIHLAFESQSTIKYKLAYNQGYNWLYYSLIDLSAGSGFSQNNNPSISLTSGSYPAVMVSWTGIYLAAADKKVAKEQEESLRRYAAVAKVGFGTSWGGFSNFSNNVKFTNNNSINSAPGSILAWSESNGQYSKFVKRNSNGIYGTITNLSSNGLQPLVSNGSALNNIEVMVFNTSTSAPYLLNKCTNDFSQGFLAKVGETNTIDISYGRSGVVEKNGIEFLFNTGDVLLDGQTIKFVERVDTLPVANLDELNTAARTESFVLNTQSELIFSNYYYVVNKNLASSLLVDEFSVTFKCELVNASTNQVVGTFDNITYNKFNIQKYANPSYLIDCSGIESGNYYLKLTTVVNDSVNLFISDIQRNDIVLEKSNLLVRNFKGEGIPIVYDLAQNYPNPFNPSTTIRYQIPQDGIVTLKIYDILGSEVATLVNDEKVAGKYEVNFNASSLASGVYIYKIQSGDFLSSKKMLLLK